MPAFQNLPWLTGSDQFLKAMLSGGEAGLERERNQQRANESAGQIGLGYARLGADERQTAARLAQAQAEQAAQEQYRQELLKDADARIQLSNARTEAAHNPFQLMSLGRGEVARVNRDTGQIETLQGAREPEATVNESQFATEADRELALRMGVGYTTVRGTPEALTAYHQAHPTAPAPMAKPGIFQRLIEQRAQSGGSGSGEVIRRLKDGRRAVFNSETKEFIRYAD